MAFREQLGMKLRAAYLTMHRRFQARLTKWGVTADQFVVLSVLAEEDGIIQKELTSRTFSDANTTAALLALLQRNGWIRREASPDDGRARCVYLTAAGRALQKTLAARAGDLHRRLFSAVDSNELQSLIASLEKVAHVMSRETVSCRND